MKYRLLTERQCKGIAGAVDSRIMAYYGLLHYYRNIRNGFDEGSYSWNDWDHLAYGAKRALVALVRIRREGIRAGSD